jgi:hypothetical protein
MVFDNAGELVEKGIMRRLPDGFDGNTCPYIFTWSSEIPNKTWGMASGCAPFYNTCKEGTANTRMVRFFDEDRFEIYANKDIEKDEELLHVSAGHVQSIYIRHIRILRVNLRFLTPVNLVL